MVLFYFREVFKAVRYARLAFILSLITTCISVLLIISSVLLLRSSGILESSVRDKIIITLFLDDAKNDFNTSGIKEALETKKYISSLRVLNKQEAAEVFIRETGENFRDVLDYNPLPASVEVKINPAFLDKNTLRSIVSELKGIPGVEDVVFQSEALFKLLDIASKVKSYFLFAALFLVFISFYLVYSTNTLIINSRRKEFEAMKLVGARLSTIKMPILLNGLFIGTIASVISLLIFVFLLSALKENFNIVVFKNNLFIYLFTLVCGPAIALLASILSVQKITLRLS